MGSETAALSADKGLAFRSLRRLGTTLLLSAAMAVTAGCAVDPEPLTEVDRLQRAEADLKQMFGDQPPIAGPIDFSEAVARAVRYNLDHRLKLMEHALAAGNLRVARYDMLPRIVAEAGYAGRNNPRGSNSQSLLDGTQSLESSTSEERDRETGKLSLVWNMLDFGVAYARAKQNADQVLIARERTRRVLDNIMLDVRNAFWRAVSAERHLGEVDALIARIRDAVDKSRRMEAQRLQEPLVALTYQRELLETLRDLIEVRRQLALAKTELAALINIRPGTKYQLTAPDFDVQRPPAFRPDLPAMERKALLDRPELREEDYLRRINKLEITKAYFRMFPRLELDVAAQSDGNSFLYHNEWVEWNLRLSYNLIRLFQGPAEIDLAEAQLSVSDARRLALTMAVMAQVHIANERYRLAVGQHRFASDLESVDARILRISRDRSAADLSDELEVIRRASNRMLSLIRLNLAYADMQNAYGRVLNAVGADPLPLEAKAETMEELAGVIRASVMRRQAELYGGVAIAAPDDAPAPLPISGPAAGAVLWDVDTTPRLCLAAVGALSCATASATDAR